MKAEDLFLLNWKKILTLLIAWTVAVVLHLMIDYFFGINELFLLLFAVAVIPLYLVVCLLYSISNKKKQLNPKNEANSGD